MYGMNNFTVSLLHFYFTTVGLFKNLNKEKIYAVKLA